MKIIQKNAWAMFLGGALGAAGWDFTTWQFYAVIVPVAILVEWSKDA